MPNSEDYDFINLTAASIKSVRWAAQKLRVDFGGGYGAAALVGPASGLHRFMLRMSALPDASTNVGTLDYGKTWFRYYYDHFIAQTTGLEENFLIRWDSRVWHVKFAEIEMDIERFKGDIYGLGVELQQVRVPAFTSYNADGSVVIV